MDDAILELRHASVAYARDITILQDLSIQVREHTITGIIGPNGAGKSTALKAMYRMLDIRAGDLFHKGERITRLDQIELIRRGVAFVPQHHSLFADLSVRDNLILGAWSIRKHRARIMAAIESVYDMFPMLAQKDQAATGTLSGGQQRFLEIGRSLMTDPTIILLDEPSAMIAPKYSKNIYRFLLQLKERGKTVVLVDQNVRQCVNVSDHLYVLELGRNKIDCPTSSMNGNAEMMRMVSSWMAHQVD